MEKKENLSEKNRLSTIEKRLKGTISNYQASTLFDYKLSEFIRLGGTHKSMIQPITLTGTGFLPTGILSVVITYANFITEMDKIKGKIQKILNFLQPPPEENGLDLPVVPPPPPTPGTQKLRQALEVITAAKTAAENAEPESAKDSLKEAKDLLKDESVRVEFKRIRQVKSWYDILEELQAVIDYLVGICK